MKLRKSKFTNDRITLCKFINGKLVKKSGLFIGYVKHTVIMSSDSMGGLYEQFTIGKGKDAWMIFSEKSLSKKLETPVAPSNINTPKENVHTFEDSQSSEPEDYYEENYGLPYDDWQADVAEFVKHAL